MNPSSNFREDRVNKAFVLCVALVLGLVGASRAENSVGKKARGTKTKVASDKAPLRLVKTILLPNIEGDFDHFGIDLKGNRLFLTAEDHHSVEVFNLKSNTRVHSIGGLGEPHNVRYLPDRNKLVVVDGGAGEVKFLKGDSYKPIDSAKLLEGADSAVFDPGSGYLYVAAGGKDAHLDYSNLSITDTNEDKHLGDIRIESPILEAMALEKLGPRMFVSDTAHSQVLVIDREKRAVVTKWPVTGTQNNVTIALDEPNHRLFLVTRTSPQFVVMDSENGKQIASLPAVTGADDMFFDAARKRIYVTAREGHIMVYEQKDPDTYSLLAKVPGSVGGKTSLFVPELNRLYVAVCKAGGSKKGSKVAKVETFEVQ
jgi:DNA-binding beta-propeller fold protein YncE